MKQITALDLDDLALGSTVLGSGGGGDPSYELLMAKQQIETYGPIQLTSIEDLSDEALIAPVAYMGAPLVSIEKLSSGREFFGIMEMIAKLKGKRVTHLLAAEIGGANALTPLLVAGRLSLPLLDGDIIGRAFPELQMSSCHLKGIKATPAVIADGLGNTIVVEASSSLQVERFCRTIAMEMGSSAAVSLYLMSGKEAKIGVISGSISKAIQIGSRMRMSDPLQGLLQESGGEFLGCGVIRDIDQRIDKGFLKGTVTIEGENRWRVAYQNEYLMVFQGEEAIAATPDIIVLLEQGSGKPITSETLSYGTRVNIVVLPAPEIWKCATGMALVGPKYFGYEEVKR